MGSGRGLVLHYMLTRSTNNFFYSCNCCVNRPRAKASLLRPANHDVRNPRTRAVSKIRGSPSVSLVCRGSPPMLKLTKQAQKLTERDMISPILNVLNAIFVITTLS
jgi:hypothetical protein